MLLPIVTLVSTLQSLNACLPIEVTLSGIVTLVRPVRLLNAFAPIDVTLSPSGETVGITISVSVQVPMPLT